MRQHLEEMAKKGWFLVELTGAVETFERGEPKPLRYAVELFDRATDYDSRPEGEAQDGIFVAATERFMFFPASRGAISCPSRPIFTKNTVPFARSCCAPGPLTL